MRRSLDETREGVPSALETLCWLPALLAALALALSPGAALAQVDLDEKIVEDDSSDLEGAGESDEDGGFDAAHWFFDIPVDVLVLRPYGFVDTLIGATFLAGVVPLIALTYSIPNFADNAIRKREWDWDWGFGNEAYERLVGDPWSYVWDRPLGQLQQ